MPSYFQRKSSRVDKSPGTRMLGWRKLSQYAADFPP